MPETPSKTPQIRRTKNPRLQKAAKRRPFDPSIGAATQFKPGVSGNPGGRPKSRSYSEALRKRVEESAEELADEQFNLVAHPKAHIRQNALDAIADRVEGKPVQGIRVESEISAYDMQILAELAAKLEAK